MLTALRNVRYQSNSGKHVLALSFSGFDPTETLRSFRHHPGGARRATSASNTSRSIFRPSRSARSRERNARSDGMRISSMPGWRGVALIRSISCVTRRLKTSAVPTRSGRKATRQVPPRRPCWPRMAPWWTYTIPQRSSWQRGVGPNGWRSRCRRRASASMSSIRRN